MLGMVVGDALGAPARGMTPYQAKKRFQTLDAFYPYGNERPGSYTYAAQLSLICAKAMTKGPYTKSLFEGEIHGAKIKTVDPETKEALKRLDDAAPRNDCPNKTAESSWLERVVPVGLLASVKNMEAKDILGHCLGVAWPTHYHKPSIAYGAAIACVIKSLVTSSEIYSNPYEMFGSEKSLMSRVVAMLKWTDQRVEPNWATEEPIWLRAQETWRMLQRRAGPEEFVGYFGLKNECADAVMLALFLFMRNPGNFKSVQQAAILGGPSNVTAALVGGMCGAYSGKFFLAQDMIDAIENSPRVVAFCEMFSTKLYEEMPKEV
jgi:ADP-ribosylglycohydrolase